MMALTPELESLLADLGAAKPYYVPVDRYPDALVRDARDQDLIEDWPDSPVGPAIVLSSLVASKLDLVLSDTVDLEASRWVPRHKSRPRRADETVIEAPDGESGAPGPLDRLIGIEDVLDAAAKPGKSGFISRLVGGGTLAPLILVGTGTPGWRPELEPADEPPIAVGPPPAGAPCPVCRGRRLSRIEACLGCLKSGVDDRLEPRPHAKKLPAANGSLAGGKGRMKAARPAGSKRRAG